MVLLLIVWFCQSDRHIEHGTEYRVQNRLTPVWQTNLFSGGIVVGRLNIQQMVLEQFGIYSKKTPKPRPHTLKKYS